LFSLDGGPSSLGVNRHCGGGFFGALRSGAQAIPDENQDYGEEKDDGGDGVDFRGDAAAQA